MAEKKVGLSYFFLEMKKKKIIIIKQKTNSRNLRTMEYWRQIASPFLILRMVGLLMGKNDGGGSGRSGGGHTPCRSNLSL